MFLSFFQILLAAQFGINLFVIFLLIRQQKTMYVTIRWAIIIMLLWCLRYVFLYIKLEDWTLDYPFLLIIDQYLFFLDGLLLWMYTRSFLQKKMRLTSYLQFLPFVVFLSLALFYSLQNPQEIRENFTNTISSLLQGARIIRPQIIGFFLVIWGLSIIYFIKSQKEVTRYSASIKDTFSNIDRIQLDWVLSYQKLWLVLFLIPMIFYSINYIYPALSVFISSGALVLSMMVLSLYFNVHVLSQDHIQVNLPRKLIGPKNKQDISPKEQQQLDHLYEQLKDQKYYQNEQLSLNELAAYMELKPTELTELIKKSKYENFYDLINSFRVEEVKDALKTSSEQIIVIAYQCGFNSKSAFNKIFKDKTGQTPKEFRNNTSI
ncbi:helix-turn-helix transcriptional regulator [Algoriphagus sp. SE2]|uniref:helix-turn-helix domain-containing protein n=1 Tax=Algoriphagus sp. SE2 TaxID=3141536 RepID=UPI0031CCFE45